MENRIDPWLVLAVLALMCSSFAILYAISSVIGGGLVVRQMVWGVVGLIVLWVCSLPHPSVLERISPVVYAATMAVLVLVLVFGEVRSGTRGWFALGPLTLQPSEFARIGVILMVAAWLGKRTGYELSVREILSVALLVGAAMGLVLLEPDFGVSMTYFPILFTALWVGGIPNRAWVLLVLLALIVGVLGWNLVLRPYQKERVLTVINPERDPYGYGYQVRQSKIAVGSGQVSGHGLGRGSQSLLRFLPAQHTDFVFAAWSEATGFIGAAGLVFAYGLLLMRIGIVAVRSEERFGLALCVLVGAWLAFQILVNLGMVLGWLPTTGVTLPLFSYGGSSLISTCAALGLVQSVWRHRLVNM